ncbi:ThiF family adenylyltransferase [uncultured Lactobacillus sp.]|uniref:ThiF family adenylyltransferase n=1 Tax=uncultured Lactobacillus sp. TaxID=153152 RepID=UPI0026071533|nr:ThiF family adenylyltransferase [uncultured Lactobacillus sp.]
MRKLRIKRTLQPLVDGDKILFGIGNVGLRRTIPNNPENIELLKFLNDEIPRDQVRLSDDQIKNKIDQLKDLGVLTTNTYSDAPRYSRNETFFEWMDMSSNINPYKYQEKLFKSKVVVLGIGGIGCAVAEHLIRAGINKIKLVDFDTVEESNLTRQTTYFEDDIGKSKLDACKRYLLKINSEIHVETIKQKVSKYEDLEKIINTKDSLIVNSMDKPAELDNWVDTVSNKYNIPVVFGSYAATATNVYPKTPNVSLNYSDFLGKEQITEDCIIDNTFPMGTLSSVTAVAAGFVSYTAIMMLTGLRIPKEGIQMDFDGWSIYKFPNQR